MTRGLVTRKSPATRTRGFRISRAQMAEGAKSFAWGCYRLVRPVVRPIAWRTRTFLNAPLLAALEQTRDAQRLVGRSETNDLARTVDAVERALLTLALEAGRRPRVSDAAIAPESTEATARIILPHGREADLVFPRCDISVGPSIAAIGKWEPHVRQFLERTVEPDWTCLDIGACIGAHTLSLASLAYMGRVIGFEADSRNSALLARNVAAMGGAIADIEIVHLALWNEATRVRLGGVNELPCSSFVSTAALDRTAIEERLRGIVAPAVIEDRDLHPRSTEEVEALPLDAWAQKRALQRVDLIKIDAEGAESRILAGANWVLQRHRPRLLVKYNPACALAHFDEKPDTFYRALAECFDDIGVLEGDGTVTSIADWTALKARLDGGTGREDLVCGFS